MNLAVLAGLTSVILVMLLGPTPKATRLTGRKVRFNASGVEEAFSAKISAAI